MTAHTYASGNTVYQFRQPQELRKAAEAVQAWWIGSDASEKLGGAPACIFMLRAALDAFCDERAPAVAPDLSRAADMLSAYAELIRRDGASHIEEHHYLPEVEHVAERLRAVPRPLSDDDIEAIASHIRPITENGAPSWEHAIARAIERAHGIGS